MIDIAPVQSYDEIESRFLEHNKKTKAFYHDPIYRTLHSAYPEGSDHALVEDLRKESTMHLIEFSLREELGLSAYKFPAYERVEDEDGNVRLRADRLGYIDAMFDPNGPNAENWPAARRDPNSINYQRATTEHAAIVNFQNSLKDAKPGETFVWTSPTVYDIHLNQHLNLQEKKQLLDQIGYGFHTFIFTYTVQENGDLQPQVHSTYLNPEGLKQLYAKAYGEKKVDEFPPDEELDMHLLGKVEKLPITADQLQIAIKEVEAMDDTEFDLPEEVPTYELEAQEVDDALAETRPLAQYYYFLQRNATSKDFKDPNVQNLIDGAYKNWRNSSYARLGGGEPKELAYFRNLKEDDLNALSRAQLNEARRLSLAARQRVFIDQIYMPDVPANVRMAALYMDQLAAHTPQMGLVATACGLGAGFDQQAAEMSGLTSYPSMMEYYASGSTPSSKSTKEKKVACQECPKCHAKNIVAIVKNRRIHCPKCGKSASYKC